MPFAKSNTPVFIGTLFALGSAILFAIRPILVKLVYQQGVDSITLIFYRMLFSAPIYLFFLWYLLRHEPQRKKLNIRNVGQICLVGLFGYYIASYLDLLGLQYISAQLARMILYTYPTFTVLLGALFFKQAMTRVIALSLGITYLGVVLIFAHDLTYLGGNVFLGAGFILVSALTFAFYLLFAKPLIEEVGSRVFTCIALLSASVAIFVHSFSVKPIEALSANAFALFLLVIIAIFCTVIPTFFTAAAVARIGAQKSGIIAMIGPGFTSLFAVCILHEAFSVYHMFGLLLAILGIWVLQRFSKST